MRILVLSLLIVLLMASGADAQVKVWRVADENPMLVIAKATFWGGVTGLLLGGAVALVVDENQDDYLKWFTVGGVFFGFGFGVYHVLTRPGPSEALLEMDEDGLALGVPTLGIHRDGTGSDHGWRGQVTLFSYSF